jgi:PIN domain nuclease of toxin-antitoxin system
MKVLLDTHGFLWFVNDDPQLSLAAKTLMESDVDLLLSVASLWEISIKVGIGKLDLPKLFDVFIPEQLELNEIELLPIELRHLTPLTSLPLHHRDPFVGVASPTENRLLISQSLVEELTILSADKIFDRYAVNRSW